MLKKTKNQKQKYETIHHEESNVEEANFIKKLLKGSGKYKGKLPFKCFDCGKVGHFASKCPYSKGTSEDGKDTRKFFKRPLSKRTTIKKIRTSLQKMKTVGPIQVIVK